MAYKEGIDVKKKEEKELVTVLSSYKEKYKEFEGAGKKSRSTFKQFDKESQKLNQRIT